MKVVVEDAKGLLRVRLDLFDFGHPTFELILCVPVIVPRLFTVAMPPNVSYG